MEFLIRVHAGVMSRWRNSILRLRGARIDGYCWLRAIEVPRNPWDIHLESDVSLDKHVTLLTTGARRAEPRIVLRRETYINRNTMLDAVERIEIGQRCLIGPFCYITDHDHDLAGQAGAFTTKATVIEEGCWLGAHVTVLKGVCIGKGSVVGAGSVVTKSLPARSIAVGNPARVIRERDA